MQNLDRILIEILIGNIDWKLIENIDLLLIGSWLALDLLLICCSCIHPENFSMKPAFYGSKALAWFLSKYTCIPRVLEKTKLPWNWVGTVLEKTSPTCPLEEVPGISRSFMCLQVLTFPMSYFWDVSFGSWISSQFNNFTSQSYIWIFWIAFCNFDALCISTTWVVNSIPSSSQ